ncbi:MAG: hypothetical protein JO256_11095 [Alphaproteobacteria bacterium]|nr:hypothetical protein [Alphaproteobacteria bacterium]
MAAESSEERMGRPNAPGRWLRLFAIGLAIGTVIGVFHYFTAAAHEISACSAAFDSVLERPQAGTGTI